jgi:hypothetical protein
MRQRICLIHGNESEARAKAEILRAAGYDAEVIIPVGPTSLQRLKSHPPAAIVIGLDRMPMRGRDIGLALRIHKTTRFIPLVFAGGDPDKVKLVAEHLPDATYCSWDEVGRATSQAIRERPPHPVVPKSALAGYKGSSLTKKLAIQPGSTIAFVGAPDGFEDLIQSMAPDVRIADRPNVKCSLVLWFVRSGVELDRNIDVMARYAQAGAIWIVWPKRSSGLDCDLSPERLRTAAMALGLVDYKVCSVDATWSGMLFTRRRAQPRDAKRDNT